MIDMNVLQWDNALTGILLLAIMLRCGLNDTYAHEQVITYYILATGH